MGKDSSMDDKWKALEKYNLWGGNTYQLGLERKSYTDKIGNFVGNNLVKFDKNCKNIGSLNIL